MKRGMLSIVFALAMLPASDAIAGDFTSNDIDQMIVEIADWSRTFELPNVQNFKHKFLFCQKQPRSVRKSGIESCYIAWFAPGDGSSPGYIHFAATNGIKLESSAGPWFRLTPEWDKALKTRIRKAELRRNLYSESSSTSTPMGQTERAYRGCWYGKGDNRYVVACN